MGYVLDAANYKLWVKCCELPQSCDPTT